MKVDYVKTGEDETWEYGERWVDGQMVSPTMTLKKRPIVDTFSPEHQAVIERWSAENVRRTVEIRKRVQEGKHAVE